MVYNIDIKYPRIDKIWLGNSSVGLLGVSVLHRAMSIMLS